MNSLSIEDDMEDDFDDLLDKFNQPPLPKVEVTPPSKPDGSQEKDEKRSEPEEPERESEEEEEGEEADEFARDLAEGMKALLAGMQQEDGGEFRKHLQDLVSADSNSQVASELLEALGQNDSTPAQSTGPSTAHETNNEKIEAETKNFQDTIKETMDKLKQSEDSAKAKNTSGTSDEDEQLSALFEKMLSGDHGLPDESQLQNILQSFMEELMSKEIMYDPLKDMNRLFPNWIEQNRGKLSAEDLKRYETQSKIIQQVIQKFEDPNWDADEKTGGDKFISRQKEVIDLLTAMQDCGPPPKEILGDMPANMFGEDGMPNPEQCLIT